MLDIEDLEKAWTEFSARLALILRPLGGATEDAVQEAFLELFELDRLPDNTLAWLVKVSRNRLIQWQRGEQRRSARQRQAVANWFQPGPADFGHDAEELTLALRRLAPEQVEIISMHIWGEMKFETIASIVGKSRSATHRTYASGLEELRKLLGQSNSVELIDRKIEP